jgi:hypothetical protein
LRAVAVATPTDRASTAQGSQHGPPSNPKSHRIASLFCSFPRPKSSHSDKLTFKSNNDLLSSSTGSLMRIDAIHDDDWKVAPSKQFTRSREFGG